VVLVSANTEWGVVLGVFAARECAPSPVGEWFTADLTVGGAGERVLFFHGGWGKIAAAASTQYVIDRWAPDLLVNLGTCGGFAGEIERGTVVLAERTLVYDIVEQVFDPAEAIAHYATDLGLGWLNEPYPQGVRRTLLVSGDRDIVAGEIPHLKAAYGAVAADWESGAIAYVAARNGVRCLILRGVSDLVGERGGEAYDGTGAFFGEQTRYVMQGLVEHLPAWIAAARTAGAGRGG